jgi:predicted RNase H-like nuclease
MEVTAGLDGWRKGWVAVELVGSRFGRAFTTSRLSQAVTQLGSARVIGVDMPIGFPSRGVRRADLAARDTVGPRRNSVFFMPPRSVIEATTYAAARTLATSAWDRGLSAQTYALRSKILEIADLSRSDHRLIEVHPEVSFAFSPVSPSLTRKEPGMDNASGSSCWNRPGFAFPISSTTEAVYRRTICSTRPS